MFIRRFTEALRPGTYLRIIGEGDLGAGDEIRVIHRPDHGLTVRDVFRIYTRDRDQVERIIGTPQISDSWKNWAETLLQKSKGTGANAAAPSCC
jgi:MOSC domain-containing protein YiiM